MGRSFSCLSGVLSHLDPDADVNYDDEYLTWCITVEIDTGRDAMNLQRTG